MKSKLFYLCVCFSFSYLCACETRTVKDDTSRRVTVEIEVAPQRETVITRQKDENRISDINMYLVGKDNTSYLHIYSTASVLRFECLPGHYDLYVVANRHKDMGKLSAQRLDDYSIEEKTDEYDVPMTAKTEIQIASDDSVVVLPTIEVRRIVSKIVYNISVDASVSDIELRAVQVFNLPLCSRLFGSDAPSDSSDDYYNGDIIPISVSGGGVFSKTLYMFENMQGTVAAVTSQQQKSEDNAPRYASFLMIRAVRGEKVLAYRVYLGENNTDDFNVRRNSCHTLNIVLKGDNEIDARMSGYTVRVTDDIEDAGYGGYCTYDSSRYMYVEIEGEGDFPKIDCRLNIQSGDGDSLYLDQEPVGESCELRLFDPRGANVFEIDYAPDVYDESNRYLRYEVEVSDEYGFSQIFSIEHTYADTVMPYAKYSAVANGKGSISVEGALHVEYIAWSNTRYCIALCDTDGCRITATPDTAYEFLGWYADYRFTKLITSRSSYDYKPETTDCAVYARFALAEHTPLDVNGTANCYIAAGGAGARYSFNACTAGNGRATDGIVPRRLSGVEARVIWESGSGYGSIVRYAVYENDRIYFSTGNERGNALIGLFDDSGNCVWSWHIWAVNYNPDVTAHTYGGGAVSMDRNLGAETTSSTDIRSKGLYYQWGRKDPFPYPASNASIGNKTLATTNNLEGYEFRIYSTHTGDYPHSVYSVEWATSHPTSFIGSAPDPYGTGYLGTWLIEYKDCLWGYPSGSKTIYDPCPPGWKVPSQSVWNKTYFKKSYLSTSYGWYMNYSDSTDAAFYPFNGYLTDNAGQFQYYTASSNARLWTCEPSVKDGGLRNGVHVLIFDSGGVQIPSTDFQANGLGVRCIKE